jgi:tetratricopeptide (TPR) repeat protein
VQSKTPDAFSRAIESALEHFADPAWLGAESPLAAPYFLGNLLSEQREGEAESAVGRGNVLRTILRQASAAETLTQEHRHLLRVAFFERNPRLNSVGLARNLGMSKATYFRHRASAIETLAVSVNQRVIPPLRAELPRPRPIVNRERVLSDGLAGLRDGQTVSITGPSGVGKTAVGATLANRWEPGKVFWFTVRPGVNDHLSSFVFALGYFLRSQGVANTWRQLVADRGAVNLSSTLGLLRHDLGTLKDEPALLCVDEADVLRQELREHAQLIHVLEELREPGPMLLIGQQPLLEAQQQHMLAGLSESEIANLLVGDEITDLTPNELTQLRSATRGNPALIKLFIILTRAGERPADVLAQLAGAVSVEALLNRIWRRMDEDERSLLMALSVFRSPSPSDAWWHQQAALLKLMAREMVQADALGGIVVAPAVRDFVQRRLAADVKVHLHLSAAEIREAHGEYTAAAYHYIQGRKPALAVWVWFNHRELETERGHAPAARELFRTIAADDLDHDADRRALTMLRAEQLLLAGAAEEAEEELGTLRWPSAHRMTPYAFQLEGDALQLQGRLEQSLEKYRASLSAFSAVPFGQIVRLHAKTGYIYALRLRNLDEARREASQALWKAHNFKGLTEEEAGNYAAAYRHYEAALAAANEIENNQAAQSEIHSHLGHLNMRLGKADDAIRHLEIALRLDERLGQPVKMLYDQFNLSSAYIVAGRHEDAFGQARAALDMAESLRHTFLIAGLTAGAAEACFHLKRLDEAEQYALRSLREEEEVHRPYALTALGWVQHAREQWQQAERTLLSAVQSAQDTQDRYAEAPAWRALGNLQRDQGRRAEASDAYERAQRLFEALNLTSEAETVVAARAALTG